MIDGRFVVVGLVVPAEVMAVGPFASEAAALAMVDDLGWVDESCATFGVARLGMGDGVCPPIDGGDCVVVALKQAALAVSVVAFGPWAYDVALSRVSELMSDGLDVDGEQWRVEVSRLVPPEFLHELHDQLSRVDTSGGLGVVSMDCGRVGATVLIDDE